MAALRETGPVPGEENGNGIKSKRPVGGDESAKKKKRTEKNVSTVHSDATAFRLIFCTGRHGKTGRGTPKARRR